MILCFGGSFNPIHRAHLLCCNQAARQAGFQNVALIPTFQSPLKETNQDSIAPIHRLNMLLLAIEAFNSKEVCYQIETLELNRAKPSYTIETAEELLKKGHSKINWLIGADQLLNLHRWHRYSELLGTVQFWIMARPGYEIDWENVDPQARMLKDNILTVSQLPISSTEIRRRIREKQDITGLVEESVREYILLHHLYL